MLAQRQVVGEGAVGLVQERDPGVADDRRRGALLASRAGAASASGSASGSSPPWSPLVQHTSQPTEPASIQRGGGAGRPEIGVVGMGGDDHEPGGPPGVGLARTAGGRSGVCRRCSDQVG